MSPSSSTSLFSRIAGAFALDIGPLRTSHEFRLLYTGQFLSTFGAALGFVVLPWQMYQLTQSTLSVGLLGLAEFGPMLLVAFAGGTLADACDRRKLILAAESGLALSCALLLANALLDEPRVWVLYVGAACVAACTALHRPAIEALTPRLVEPEQLPAVAALAMFRGSFGHIIGPVIAIKIAETSGAASAYAVNLGTYLIAIVSLLLLRSVPVPPDTDRPGLRAIADGLRYARTRPELIGTYLVDIIAMFFAMPLALFPAMAQHHGASVGIFYSTLALGPMAMTLTSRWMGRIHRHGIAIIAAVLVWGGAIIGFGLAPSLGVALGCIFIAGAADSVSGIFRMTIWNQTIPDRMRGRMASIEMVSYLTGPYLGNTQVGFTASLLGLRAGIACGGAVCIAGVVALALCLPAFARYDSRAALARKAREDARGPASEA